MIIKKDVVFIIYHSNGSKPNGMADSPLPFNNRLSALPAMSAFKTQLLSGPNEADQPTWHSGHSTERSS